MRTNTIKTKLSLLLSLLVILLVSQAVYAGATITVINVDGPGEGFNDPTAAAPVGGNSGTTLGQQRLIAFQFAANRWGETLDSNVQIFVTAAFNPLGANVLGSAGTIFIFRDFPGLFALYPGVEFPGTWYGSALADKRAGVDLNAGFADINAQFSSNFNFYLGLDNNHGVIPDLVTVVLHELAHGLNFQTFVNPATGANVGGFTDIYARHLLDTTTGLHWNQMTNAQRQAASIKFGRVVWDGSMVSLDLPTVLSFGSPEVRVLSPAALAGEYQFGTAAFGPKLGSPNVSGNVVAAVDPLEVGGTTTDGCSAFTNAAAVAGKIALVERGLCGFAAKARNATNAGAIGVVIYNNAANAGAAPPAMADDGINGVFVTIPTVSLTRADGLSIVAALGGGVNASLSVNPAIRAGADALGRARLYAPFPVAAGSSISHFDTVAFRNLLMEPAINNDLTHNVKAPDDLTLELLRDVGWFPDADLDGLADSLDCSPNSDLRPTIIVDGCDSGVSNTLFTNGCTISDLIAQAASSARNHGDFVSNVARLTNALRSAGLISDSQKGAIQSCAAGSSLH